MQATADSKIISRYSGAKTKGKVSHGLLTTWLPNKVRRRWPAIMLAVRRTDSVTGRMILLVSSIRTIKGIRAAGAPSGTRWAKNSVKLLVNLNMIKASHIGRARERVIAKCLVAVKVNDKRPIVLLSKSRKKRLTNKKILIFLFFSSVSNSLFIALITFLRSILKGLERAQYEGTIATLNKAILTQFIGAENKARGSKIENRLFIIFKSEN